jgi:hypothetical protein
VPVRRVVRHNIDDHLDGLIPERRNHAVEVVEVAQLRINVAIVVDVVAAIRQCRRVERAQPDRVHAKFGQISDLGQDAVQVADAVPIAVGEATRIDLVDDRLPPPLCVHLASCRNRWGRRLDRLEGEHFRQ